MFALIVYVFPFSKWETLIFVFVSFAVPFNPKHISVNVLSFVNVNEKLNTALVNVVGIYENGDRELLPTNNYQIIADDVVAIFGKKYSIKIKYNENISKEVPVIIRKHVEGENTNIVGGSVVNEP